MPAVPVDDQRDLAGLEAELSSEYGVHLPLVQMHAEREELDAEEIGPKVQDAVAELFGKEAQVGGETMRMLEKHVMLNVLDQNWRSTWAAWTTCARASTCAATPRSSPSRNTRRKPSSCSRNCWRR